MNQTEPAARRRKPWPWIAAAVTRAAVAVLTVAAAAVVVLLGGLVLTAPTSGPAPAPARTAQLGATCDQRGEYAVTPNGRLLACTTTLADRTPRWRTGQLDLPTR